MRKYFSIKARGMKLSGRSDNHEIEKKQEKVHAYIGGFCDSSAAHMVHMY